MPQGIIQYATDAEFNRIQRCKQSLKQAFIDYIIGFGNHTCEITRHCPVCGEKALKTEKVQADINGGAIIRYEQPATIENLKSSFIIATWKCQACGHQEQSRVSFEELRQDFNNPKLRK